MRSTIKDVAKLANTSPATVSLVLNGRPGVNKDTRARVLAAVEKLNYRPNQIARSLINQKADSLGLIVTDIHNPFYGDLAYLMQKEMDKREMSLTLGISNNKVKNERKIIENMVNRGVDGIMLVPARDGEDDLQHLYALREMGIPFVFVTSAYQGIAADTVMTDLEQATHTLTRHLLKTGERKIIFVVENRRLLHVERRIAGFHRALQGAGVPLDENCIIEIDPDTENGMLATQEKILGQQPDAIIAINAFTALGIMKGLKDSGVSIPGDISVSCFDDLEFASVLYTPLTAVRQPVAAICEQALTILAGRLSGASGAAPVQTLLPGELIVRGSTK